MDHVALEGDQLSLKDMHSAELILDFAEPVVGGFEVYFRREAFLTYDPVEQGGPPAAKKCKNEPDGRKGMLNRFPDQASYLS